MFSGGAASASKKITVSDINKIKEKERVQQELAAKEKEKQLKKLGENPEMEEHNPNIKMAEILSEEGNAMFYTRGISLKC